MILNKKVKIFTEKSKKIGYGHFNRSEILFKYLVGKNIDIQFIDLSSFENNLNHISGEIYLIDTPSFADKIIEIAHRKSIISISFDHFGNRIPDYNIVIFPHSKPKANLSTFIGFKHVVFNERILSLNSDISVKDYILICLGGADVNKQSLEIAKNLCQYHYKVKVVLGPLAQINPENSNFEVFHNPANFFELISKAKHIICNGGNTLFECVYLKKSVFVFPQSTLEETIAHELHSKGLVVGYSKKEFNTNHFIKSMDRKVSFQNNVFDSLGKERILNILKNL